MKKYKVNILTTVIIFCFNLLICNAQREATPLTPEESQIQREVGLILGFGQNIEKGSFNTNCPCKFEKGLKFGFTIGGLYEQEIFEWLRWGGALIYDLKSITASYMEIEEVDALSEITQRTEKVSVSVENQADLGISYLTLIPYFKFLPFDFLYFKIGPGLSYVLSSSVKHTQTALQKTVLLSSGELGTVTFGPGGSLTKTIEDGAYPDVNQLQLSIEPILGLTFPLSKNIYFGGSIQYSIPLTDFSQKDSGFRINSWRILLELRIALTTRTKFANIEPNK
jgi:hypothetical protein